VLFFYNTVCTTGSSSSSSSSSSPASCSRAYSLLPSSAGSTSEPSFSVVCCSSTTARFLTVPRTPYISSQLTRLSQSNPLKWSSWIYLPQTILGKYYTITLLLVVTIPHTSRLRVHEGGHVEMASTAVSSRAGGGKKQPRRTYAEEDEGYDL